MPNILYITYILTKKIIEYSKIKNKNNVHKKYEKNYCCDLCDENIFKKRRAQTKFLELQ